MNKKKVLVVGNLYALVKKLSQLVEKVYVVPGNQSMSAFAECVDIREDNPVELLDFVLENEIDLSIVTSDKAISSDIAGLFQANGKAVFAPTAKSAEIATSKALGKRFLYKLHAPTPKFAIFEKLPLVLDYLKEANYPLVIRTESNQTGRDRMCCTVFEHAKNFVEDLFSAGENKVVIEEYTYGHNFSMYVVTDGYHAIPLADAAKFKFTENGDGGILTSGVGSYVPDYKVPACVKDKLFKNVILNAINSLERKGTPYSGILGVEAVYTGDDSYVVTEFKPFFDDCDAQAILNSVDENLIDLFEACANGFFADEYEDILLNDNHSVSCVISSRSEGKLIKGLESVDSEVSFIAANEKASENYTVKGANFVLTSVAKTLSRAKNILKDDVENINFDGIKYRSDIYS